MDNAPIHKPPIVYKTITSLGCFCIYNAPYSAEMNPIERIFGVFEMKAEKELFSCTSFSNLLEILLKYFYEIGQRTVSDTIASVQSVVWADVYNRCDI